MLNNFEPTLETNRITRILKIASYERGRIVDQDPFGNLNEWGNVIKTLEALSDIDGLERCQPGLVRILKYKGNWRLREEALNKIKYIQAPSRDLLFQLLDLLADDNIYYDVRILAGDALSRLLRHVRDDIHEELRAELMKTVEKLKSMPQPFFFDSVLRRLSPEAGL